MLRKGVEERKGRGGEKGGDRAERRGEGRRGMGRRWGKGEEKRWRGNGSGGEERRGEVDAIIW